MDRQVVDASIVGPQRREFHRQAVSRELENALGPPEVAQLVFAQVTQHSTRWEVVAEQFRRGSGEQHLAAVTGIQQAGDSVERRPEVVAIALFGNAGVQGHSYLQGGGHTRRFREEVVLGDKRSAEDG